MECFSPIKLNSRSKFVSPCFSDTFVQYVRCGSCAACQETLSREWYFRAFYEYQDTIANNGYMLLDCLTYSPKYVPRVDRFFREKRHEGNFYFRLPRKLNFMCFDYRDIRLFLVKLRRYLEYRGYNVENTLRYFAAAEYGTDDGKTHRPHIHILFYCTTPNLDNFTLSKAISACWKYGRTDGLPYKSRHYVNEYTIREGLASSQRACKYVSKYVMKSSEFQLVVNKRLSAIMHYLYEQRFTRHYLSHDYQFELDYYYRKPKQYIDWSSYNSFMSSEFAKKLYRDLKRKLNQFHLQSLGFGAGYLSDCDLNSIMNDNIICIPDGKQVVMRLGLPMYYKRKLFYEQIKIDGRKYWQLTDFGKQYAAKRKEDRKKQLVNEFSLSFQNYGYQINEPYKVADYVIEKRGKIKGLFGCGSGLLDRVNSPLCFFNYNTPSDRAFFHQKFMTTQYLRYVGRYDNIPHDIISIDNFITENVYFDDEIEAIIYKYEEKKSLKNEEKQKLHDNKQRLNQVYKNLKI